MFQNIWHSYLITNLHAAHSSKWWVGQRGKFQEHHRFMIIYEKLNKKILSLASVIYYCSMNLRPVFSYTVGLLNSKLANMDTAKVTMSYNILIIWIINLYIKQKSINPVCMGPALCQIIRNAKEMDGASCMDNWMAFHCQAGSSHTEAKMAD